MHHHYLDIIAPMSAAGREPEWWDEHGVPRYAPFVPGDCANIYADEVVLLLINCQGCGTPFRVCMTQTRYDRAMFEHNYGRPGHSLAEQIKWNTIHYGDPPNTGCCAGGATMNSVPVLVLEYWMRGGNPFKMERVADLEVPVSPKWASKEES